MNGGIKWKWELLSSLEHDEDLKKSSYATPEQELM